MKNSRPALATISTLMMTATLSVVLPILGAPQAAAEVACGFSTSAFPNAAIPDNGEVTATVDLGGFDFNDPLVDLDVIINITHPYDEDLEVSLSYGGNTVVLTSRRGGSSDNYTNTRFNDGSPTRIGNGTPPFTGHFRPEQSLNAFDDVDPSGLWTLTVADKSGTDVGTLNSWFMVMQTQWCSDGDRDTVKDDYDLCPEVKGVTPHGCPLRARTVTLTYSQASKEFRGKVQATNAARCKDGQPVRVYKRQAGKDAVVGRVFTNATGNYVAPKSNVSGNYYAVAPKVVEEGVAECSLAQSADLHL